MTDTAASRLSQAEPAPPGDGGRRWHIVGGGIAGLAAAAYLVRDGGVPGGQIQVLEASQPGGSLDASGSAEAGFSMRGSRMLGPAYALTYELLDGIPSLHDATRSVTQDTFEFWQAAPWYAKARLVEQGRILDATDWGLRNRDRAGLVKFMLQTEESLGARRIDECFEAPFFESNFWWLWASMFGFQAWHSAAELRRYLLRFLRLFPDLETMQIIQSTRYNGRDAIVRPLVAWLQGQGVHFATGVQVTDLHLAARADGLQVVQRIDCLRQGHASAIDLGAEDRVIVTLGSMTADASLGSMDHAPAPRAAAEDGSWALWKRLAARSRAFGRPWAFCGQVEQTRWITFTVTDRGHRFAALMEAFSGNAEGRGGLVTLKASGWGLTFHLYHPPAYAGQPEGTGVWWGYGLFADRPGQHVPKAMADCSGREILTEVFGHLGLQSHAPELLASSTCIPCLLPYTTSQFMPRVAGDRPQVRPEGTAQLAVVGQYCELPHDVVYTVEYSVHSARQAVCSLLGLSDAMPPVYQGLEHPNALVEAMRRVLR